MVDTLVIWIRVGMMRIVIRREGSFMLDMVWRVGIGVCLRVAFVILLFPRFVLTGHSVPDYPLMLNYISTSYKKCRFPEL